MRGLITAIIGCRLSMLVGVWLCFLSLYGLISLARTLVRSRAPAEVVKILWRWFDFLGLLLYNYNKNKNPMKGIRMGKKKKHVTPIVERAEQAKANAANLADAFLLLGLTVETWETNLNEGKTASVVSTPELVDSEGWPFEFYFSHESGQIITNNL